MKSNWSIGGMFATLALLASPDAIAQKPLRMDLPQASVARPARPATAPRPHRRSFNVPQPRVLDRDLRLTDRQEARQDAISSLGVGLLTGLDDTDTTAPTTPDAGYPQLRFKKHGHLARDIKRSYRNMGENLAKKVFDDPRGKRIVFDVDGKPGVGVEIPLR